MSVAQPPPPAPPARPTRQPDRNEIVIYSHSNLFYWWPVWVLGLVFALITYLQDTYMVVVPGATQPLVMVTGTAKDRTFDPKTKDRKDETVALADREAWVLPEKDKDGKRVRLPRVAAEAEKVETSAVAGPRLHVTRSSRMGVLFCATVLLVIVFTNVPLRGMWSVLVIISLVTLSLIFHLMGWWDDILRRLSLLDIRINLGGYLFLSLVLFGIWLFTMLFFDRQIYMIFTPGQLKVCTEIGGGEKVYDAMGMQLEKQRSDFFRHWILGLGSGDLIVKTAGAQAHTFDLPNVLFISKKVQQIEDMLKIRPTREVLRG